MLKYAQYVEKYIIIIVVSIALLFTAVNSYGQKTITYNKGIAGTHIYPIKTNIGNLSLWISLHSYVNTNVIDGSYSDIKISFQRKKRGQRFYLNYYFRYFYKNKMGSYVELRCKI